MVRNESKNQHSLQESCELRHLISGKSYSGMLNLQASLHSICNFSVNEFAMIRQFQFPRRKKKRATIYRKLLCYAGVFHYNEKPCMRLQGCQRSFETRCANKENT